MKPLAHSSRSGVALILVLLSMALLTVLSLEIIVASRVDLRIGRNARERLQAQYLAQSAVNFGLLRFQLYRTVKNLMAGQGSGGVAIPGLNDQIVNGLWSFPLPNLPLPGMEAKNWPGSISSSITSEGSKIPINMLDGVTVRGSSEEMVKSVRVQIENLINGMLQDENFDELYHGLRPEDLIDPLIDWVDADDQKLSGGEESRYYERLNPPYTPRNDRIPVLSELHMIENWSDDLVRRLAPQFTVLNNSGKINPNYVSLDRLRAFEPRLTPEDLLVIQQRRLENPFQSLKEMENFIQTDPDIKNGKNFKFPEGLGETNKETVFFLTGSGIVNEIRRTLKLGIHIEEQPPTKKAGESEEERAKRAGKLLEPRVVLVEEVL